ncbi:hypothetical protein [Rhodococcus sp. BS-15]|uniref:hypothetical protein n=1 Tax=Rhodococcus sp. BS-15 TaxID=1304954 RepID=UPI000AA9A7F4|nr:hypothetical protein [Rhodococcus sp. BS-15]
MNQQRKYPLRRIVLVSVATASTVAVAVGVGAFATAISGNDEQYGTATVAQNPAATTSPNAAGDPGPDLTSRVLTLPTAATVLDNHERAKETQDAALFTASTCAGFIAADEQQRGLGSVGDLLSAYERAKKYVPVQFVENIRALDASGAGMTGSITISAKITDNRFVPPTEETRSVQIAMNYEEGRWKLCPTLDPL